jgi:hypothetical protein
MTDQTLSADRPSESVCPWCSAAIVPGSPTCASCGASLESEEDRDVPGLTAVDMAILRGEKKEEPAPSRNRLLSWISGDYTVEPAPPTPSESQALAPPDPEVQREIIRLELEAEVANLQAEADSLLSEAVVDGRVSELPEDVQELATGEFDAEMLAAATADGAALPAAVDAPPASADIETAPDGETAPAEEAAPADEAAADDEVPLA